MSKIVSSGEAAKLLREAFDHVCDKSNWKNPIDCIVPWSMANIYMQAIQFMAGGPVECIRMTEDEVNALRGDGAPDMAMYLVGAGGQYARLTSAGYYVNIGA